MRVSALIVAIAAGVGCAAPPAGGADEHAGVAHAKLGVCGALSLVTDAAAPTTVATVVHATAAAACAEQPVEYRFWVTSAGRGWTVARDWSADPSLAWDTTGAFNGAAMIEVDVRIAGAEGAYDQTSTAFDLTGGKAHCWSVALDGDGTARTVGATIPLSATAACEGAAAEYRFWARAPGGAWTVVRDYGTDPAFAIDSSAFSPGTASIEVDARVAGSNAYVEAALHQDVRIDEGPAAPCSAITMAVDTSTGSPRLSASATCGGDAEYRFWVREEGGSWRVLRDYDASAELVIDPTQLHAGVATFEIDARNAGSSSYLDVQVQRDVTIDGGAWCASVDFDGALEDTEVGSRVLVDAIATCPSGTAEYRFWLNQPGIGWTMVRDYDASRELDWSTTGLPLGTYTVEIDARAAGQPGGSIVQKQTTIQLIPAPVVPPGERST